MGWKSIFLSCCGVSRTSDHSVDPAGPENNQVLPEPISGGRFELVLLRNGGVMKVDVETLEVVETFSPLGCPRKRTRTLAPDNIEQLLPDFIGPKTQSQTSLDDKSSTGISQDDSSNDSIAQVSAAVTPMKPTSSTNNQILDESADCETTGNGLVTPDVSSGTHSGRALIHGPVLLPEKSPIPSTVNASCSRAIAPEVKTPEVKTPEDRPPSTTDHYNGDESSGFENTGERPATPALSEGTHGRPVLVAARKTTSKYLQGTATARKASEVPLITRATAGLPTLQDNPEEFMELFWHFRDQIPTSTWATIVASAAIHDSPGI